MQTKRMKCDEENNQRRKRTSYSGKLSGKHSNVSYFLKYIFCQILYSLIVLEQKGVPLWGHFRTAFLGVSLHTDVYDHGFLSCEFNKCCRIKQIKSAFYSIPKVFLTSFLLIIPCNCKLQGTSSINVVKSLSNDLRYFWTMFLSQRCVGFLFSPVVGLLFKYINVGGWQAMLLL